MRDHGGNMDQAIRRFGGAKANWLDLSTGINRSPYPIATLSDQAFHDLPTTSAMDDLLAAAAQAYDTKAPIAALAGAQQAIQLVPLLRPLGRARVLAPTYNEHAAALRLMGWDVAEVFDPKDLAGADLAIVVNPNNPDGRHMTPSRLAALGQDIGLLVVDESFADMTPDMSMAPFAGKEGLLVLRSFGKFYGLAGLRLGFAIGHSSQINHLRALAGPWPVAGPAIEIASRALQDRDWSRATRERLKADGQRLDLLAQKAGWGPVGGSDLFRLYQTQDARAAQNALAENFVWTRIFPYSDHWIRLGFPGDENEWQHLERALMLHL